MFLLHLFNVNIELLTFFFDLFTYLFDLLLLMWWSRLKFSNFGIISFILLKNHLNVLTYVIKRFDLVQQLSCTLIIFHWFLLRFQCFLSSGKLLLKHVIFLLQNLFGIEIGLLHIFNQFFCFIILSWNFYKLINWFILSLWFLFLGIRLCLLAHCNVTLYYLCGIHFLRSKCHYFRGWLRYNKFRLLHCFNYNCLLLWFALSIFNRFFFPFCILL